MGRKKINVLNYVEEQANREIAYSKRKRVILKQCIELSKMCGQDICLTMFDKSRQKLVQYCSSYEFTPKVSAQLLQPSNLSMFSYKAYTNDDYNSIANVRDKKDQNSKLSAVIIPQNEEEGGDQDSNTFPENCLEIQKGNDLVEILNMDHDLEDFLIPTNSKITKIKQTIKRKGKVFRKDREVNINQLNKEDLLMTLHKINTEPPKPKELFHIGKRKINDNHSNDRILQQISQNSQQQSNIMKQEVQNINKDQKRDFYDEQELQPNTNNNSFTKQMNQISDFTKNESNQVQAPDRVTELLSPSNFLKYASQNKTLLKLDKSTDSLQKQQDKNIIK